MSGEIDDDGAGIDIEPVSDKNLFCFGFGYTCTYLAAKLFRYGWTIGGTTTTPEKVDYLQSNGINAVLFDPSQPIADPLNLLHDATHILLSVPPDGNGDPVCEAHGMDLSALGNVEWVGYLSTTGVYGNREGDWVDETSQTTSTSRRGMYRIRAEKQWMELYQQYGLPVHIFRLSGIYGPGRSAIDSVRAGTARRIDKPGHVFNRIHIYDLVQTLVASINKPKPGSIYNVTDDQPAPSSEVIEYACQLLGMELPPVTSFDDADMAPMVRSFYADNKRVKNDKIKKELGLTLAYPDYKSGLESCLDVERELEAQLSEGAS